MGCLTGMMSSFAKQVRRTPGCAPENRMYEFR